MDSELTSEASVKALNQGVATTDSPTFAAVTVNGNVEFDGLSGTGSVTVTDILDQDDMSGNSATALATQQSIKAYVDSTVAATNELVEDTTPQLGGDLDTNGNDILFADNDKAIFGAGSDLQIFHDPSAGSIIQEAGAGSLFVRASTNIQLEGVNGENMAIFNENGSVQLYYDNAEKLATTSTGIDVTGTVTADGNAYTAFIADGTSGGAFKFYKNGSQHAQIFSDGSGDLVFRNNTDSERMRISSSGNVGIGTSSPSFGLSVESDNGSGYAALFRKSSSDPALAIQTTSGVTQIQGLNSALNATHGIAMQVSGGNVGIGVASPSSLLHLKANAPYITFEDDDNNQDWQIQATAWFAIRDQTAGEERMRIDSSGNILFGATGTATTSYGAKVLKDSSSEIFAVHRQAADGDLITFARGGTDAGGISYAGGYLDVNGQVNGVTVSSGGTERMRIDSSGNVGIGATSLTNKLTVNGDQVLLTNGELKFADATNNQVGTIRNSGSAATSQLEFLTANTERMRISSAGDVQIGTAAVTGGRYFDIYNTGSTATDFAITRFITQQVGSASTTSADIIKRKNGQFGFINNDTDSAAHINFTVGASEAMRIDSSGNLLVGKTSSAFGTAGVEINQNGVAGKVHITRVNAEAIALNRMNSDGNIAEFYKGSSIVGSAGSVGGYFYIGSPTTSDTFLTFVDSAIRPSTSSGAGRDDAIDLGQSGNRFDDIYATNGTIQTSDRNDKQDIEELSDAEQRVAVACKGLLRKFRWKSSVEEKGEDARIHFGIIAQDLQDAFTAEGLDAGRYGMFINSTWTDEETGEERSRMGVRYSELLAFIISAI